MTDGFFGAGATLAGITNFEMVVSGVANHLDNGRIPYSGPVATRLMDSFLRRDGKINNQLVFDDATDTDRMALNLFLFGDQLTNCAELYVTALDEFGFYTPYLAVVDRPYELQNYIPVNETYYRNGLILPLNWCRIQSVNKSANYTLSINDGLLYVDTTSGDVTITMFAASAINANVPRGIVKTTAAHNLIIARAGSDLIDGATSKTLTAKNARADLYSDHVSTFTSILY